MKIETTYTFTDEEIKEAVKKVRHYQAIDMIDLFALTDGAEKWVNFKKECENDPSYQWGFGHTYK